MSTLLDRSRAMSEEKKDKKKKKWIKAKDETGEKPAETPEPMARVATRKKPEELKKSLYGHKKGK